MVFSYNASDVITMDIHATHGLELVTGWTKHKLNIWVSDDKSPFVDHCPRGNPPWVCHNYLGKSLYFTNLNKGHWSSLWPALSPQALDFLGHLGMIPPLTMIPVRSQWSRYSLWWWIGFGRILWEWGLWVRTEQVEFSRGITWTGHNLEKYTMCAL